MPLVATAPPECRSDLAKTEVPALAGVMRFELLLPGGTLLCMVFEVRKTGYPLNRDLFWADRFSPTKITSSKRRYGDYRLWIELRLPPQLGWYIPNGGADSGDAVGIGIAMCQQIGIHLLICPTQMFVPNRQRVNLVERL